MVIVQTLFVPREPSPPRTLNQRYTHIDVSTQRPPASNGYFPDHRLPLNHDSFQDPTAASGADREGYRKRKVIFGQELHDHFISRTVGPWRRRKHASSALHIIHNRIDHTWQRDCLVHAYLTRNCSCPFSAFTTAPGDGEAVN